MSTYSVFAMTKSKLKMIDPCSGLIGTALFSIVAVPIILTDDIRPRKKMVCLRN